MYLMARKIKTLGIKMVLSGEGSDEVFGGYLYFHKAPSPEEFHKELTRKLKALHSYDCLRAHKSTMAWGVETRVPFLDKEFLEVAMNIDPAEKMIKKKNNGNMENIRDQIGGIEKYILRKAFDDKEKPFLPDSILWRQKEQFSDGVGYGWIDGLKKYAENQVTDSMFLMAANIWPEKTPTSKEAFLYRSIFDSLFPQHSASNSVPYEPSVACSSAVALEWDKNWKKMADPSGRAVLGVHQQDLSTA
jgi:asparagine synthase (glutamine-hydrolysing)